MAVVDLFVADTCDQGVATPPPPCDRLCVQILILIELPFGVSTLLGRRRLCLYLIKGSKTPKAELHVLMEDSPDGIQLLVRSQVRREDRTGTR